MLWFNFILGLIFIFFCINFIIIHYYTQKQKKIKIKPRIKLNHNISLLSKRFHMVSEQRKTGFGRARNEMRAKKWKRGEGEGKEGNACRQTPRFWKPAFASERSAWLARLVEQCWHVSIKDLFHTERTVWYVTVVVVYSGRQDLPFFPTPTPLFYLCHFLRGLWLSFLVLCS